jgi:hypothetical protein
MKTAQPKVETHYLVGYNKVKAFKFPNQDVYRLLVTPSTARYQNVKHTNTGIQFKELEKEELVSELLGLCANYLDDRTVDETLAESMGPEIVLDQKKGAPFKALLQNARLYTKTNRLGFTVRPRITGPGEAEKFKKLMNEFGRKGSITISSKSNGKLREQQEALERFFINGMYDMDFILSPASLLPSGATGKGTLVMSTTSNINGSKVDKRITSTVINPAGIALTSVSVLSPDSSTINIDTNSNNYRGTWGFNEPINEPTGTLTIQSSAYYALFGSNIFQTIIMKRIADNKYTIEYYRDGVIFNKVTLTKKP